MIKQIKNSEIQSTKEILGGEPVFRGTRVPVRTLIEYFEAGDCIDDFLQDFPTVSKQQALRILDSFKKEIAKG